MKDATKVLIKGAIINCGIATALINGIISYFTLTKAPVIFSQDLAFNFFSTALGCGVICPFFGGLILKGVLAKNSVDFGAKKDQMIARFVPDNVFLGALVIGAMAVIMVWAVPYVLAAAVSLNFSLKRFAWVVLIALYSGLAAGFAAYFGMKRSYFAKQG